MSSIQEYYENKEKAYASVSIITAAKIRAMRNPKPSTTMSLKNLEIVEEFIQETIARDYRE